MKNNDKDVTFTATEPVAVQGCDGATENAETGIAVQIPGSTEYIGIARDAVDAFGKQLHLPPDTRAAIKLAVGEACNNAALHSALAKANLADTSRLSCAPVAFRPITVAARTNGDALEIEVSNHGNGFHPTMGGAMPDAYAEHGRGIALMEMLMDSVEYLSVNGDTVVRLRKRLRPDALAPVKS